MEMVSEAPLANKVVYKTIIFSCVLFFFVYICSQGKPLKVSQLDSGQKQKSLSLQLYNF